MKKFLKKVLRRIKSQIIIFSEPIYAYFDSTFLLNRFEKTLFIDLGANLGQGFKWFSRFYGGKKIDFELFEPNPYCFAILEKIKTKEKITLHNKGVGIKSGIFKFYGLNENNRGKLSEGGSIVFEHNSDYYKSNYKKAIDVNIIDFSSYIKEKSKIYDKIIVKMDIEGAEIELLEKMINDNSISLINLIYLEFHSQYQEKKFAIANRKREKQILKSLSLNKNIEHRIWH